MTGAQFLGGQVRADLTDIFALQDEVTVAVVSAIQPKLLQTEIGLAARRRPENLTAYDFYLRAMRHWYLWNGPCQGTAPAVGPTREGLAEAIRLAHRALGLLVRFRIAQLLAFVVNGPYRHGVLDLRGCGKELPTNEGHALKSSEPRESQCRFLPFPISRSGDSS